MSVGGREVERKRREERNKKILLIEILFHLPVLFLKLLRKGKRKKTKQKRKGGKKRVAAQSLRDASSFDDFCLRR